MRDLLLALLSATLYVNEQSSVDFKKEAPIPEKPTTTDSSAERDENKRLAVFPAPTGGYQTTVHHTTHHGRTIDRYTGVLRPWTDRPRETRLAGMV